MMIFNKYFARIILTACISTIITSCSSWNRIIHNKKHDGTFNDILYQNNQQNNNVYDAQKIPSKIQELNDNNIIYFTLDRYNILPQFFNILNIHANFLSNNPLYQIRIEGHTDERGTAEYNIALGERRANSVKSYLQSKGVLSNQIITISYGKEQPIAIGHDEEAYSKNRRVVLIYTHK